MGDLTPDPQRLNPGLRRVYSPAEIAERYGVGRSKVIGWIRSGQLRAVNLAGQTGAGRRDRWRISGEDLTAFEATRQSTGVGGQGSGVRAEPRRIKPPGRREMTEYIEQ